MASIRIPHSFRGRLYYRCCVRSCQSTRVLRAKPRETWQSTRGPEKRALTNQRVKDVGDEVSSVRLRRVEQGDEGSVISSFEVVSPSLLISDVQVLRVLALRGILLTVESQMEITRTVEWISRWWIRGSSEIVVESWRQKDEKDGGNMEERKKKD